MPCVAGVVQTPWGADMVSFFGGMLAALMVTMGDGRGGCTSLVYLLLGPLKAKEGI